MREISEIQFTTGGDAANRQLIDRYVLDAVDRLPTLDYCDHVAFMPLTDDSVGGGNLWLTVAGDGETLVAHESEEWNALLDEGLVSDWDVTEVTEDWYKTAGDEGGELLFRLHAIANQTTKAVYHEFENPPAAVDSYPEENSTHPIGWWMVPHIGTAHLAYSFEETIDALLYGIRHTAEDIAEFDSPDEAVQQLETCIRSLETLRDDLTEELASKLTTHTHLTVDSLNSV